LYADLCYSGGSPTYPGIFSINSLFNFCTSTDSFKDFRTFARGDDRSDVILLIVNLMPLTSSLAFYRLPDNFGEEDPYGGGGHEKIDDRVDHLRIRAYLHHWGRSRPSNEKPVGLFRRQRGPLRRGPYFVLDDAQAAPENPRDGGGRRGRHHDRGEIDSWGADTLRLGRSGSLLLDPLTMLRVC
jgi:hypothetical protein